MAKALSIFIPALRNQLKGSVGVAFDLERAQGGSLQEALTQFNAVEGLVAILPKELSAVKVEGVTTLRLSSVAGYRPALSLQNPNSVPVLEGASADAGIAANDNLFSVVSEGTATGLSEQARDLLDKVSRIAVAVLLAQKLKKTSDLAGKDWKSGLLSELTFFGMLPNESLISLENGRVTVHQKVLAAIIQQMVQAKATAVSA